MKRKLLTLLIWALAAFAAWAVDITEEQARTVAANFVEKDAVGMRILTGRAVDTVTKRGGLWLVALKPSGHLFVSVNRSAEPIPSFSENDFAAPEAGSPQEAFLAAAETNSINATGTKYEARWRMLLGEKTLRLTASSVKAASAEPYVNIDPLMQSVWTQGYPYNELIPVINGSHTPVGCVATAYSQILRFWQWPEVLDEDIVAEHSVDAMWGHKWRLKAGTRFDWADMPYSGGYDNPTRLKLGRAAMFAGMLAHMSYKAKASAAQTSQPGKNRWFTAQRALGSSNSTLAEREAAMKASLEDGCPFMVSVDTADGGHAVVGDGWQESAGGTYVHLNYGWGSADNSYYGTATALDVFLGAKPRPMVTNKPLPPRAKLPLTVEWTFPTKGYDDTLAGFEIAYTEVEDEIADWCDDMSDPTGTVDGDCISVETVDATGHGDVMRVGTKAEDATYTWPTMVATENTVFSYDIHSKEALGMTVEVQLLDPSVGWTTLATPEISERSEIAWTTRSFDLGGYAGKGIAIRVKATRTGSSSYNDDTSRSTGVQFDNITFTKVRQAKSAVAGKKTAAKDARSFAISDPALVSGKTYLFQVTPAFSDETVGIPGYRASCTIAPADDERPTITSVASVVASAPKVQDGMYRDCYFGLNQFGVYGSSALTSLEAHLSNLAVIGEVETEDTTQPAGTMITTHGKVSIESAVEVEKKEDGKFLVKVDVSNLTAYLRSTGMILTLVGRNAAGDAVQKDVFLSFTKMGGETEIAVADLPDAGAISGGGDTPAQPSTTYHQVSFATMGGFAVGQMTVEQGKAIGTLPNTSRDGYTFLGWFTQISGGTRVTEDTVITGNVTYYAHWQENAPAVATCTVTFDPNGGTPEMSRFVTENAAVGTLPTTVTKSGFKLVGWFTAKDGGTQIDAAQIITGNVTYYAHWEVSSGGDTGGGSSDDGSTRFCHGVSKTAGAKMVTRSGTGNRLIPASYNLLLWWVDRYNEAHGTDPDGYTAPDTSSIPSDGSYTIRNYAAKLIGDTGLSAVLPAGAEREKYFPSVDYAPEDWYGSATGNDRAKAIGRKIYEALASGPIGIRVRASMKYVAGAVIWGCDYATDNGEKYATKLYITDTTLSQNVKLVQRDLGTCTTTDGYYSGVGIKSFNSSNSGIIENYYPITGLVVTKPDEPVATCTVTFVADGGSAVGSIQVEKGSTVGTLPTTVRSGYTFVGWFDGDAQLTTETKISADATYTARWHENIVTPSTFTVVFDANGGSVPEVSREVACDTAVGELPVPTYAGHSFLGWYLDGVLVDENTIVGDSVVYTAKWEADASDEAIGIAPNDGDPGNDYTSTCGYEMYDNYWTARKRAIKQGKQLFILSGAAWCSNCAFVKNYLKTLGSAFADRFVVYYADHDSTACQCFQGGLPQYGAADPRAVDAFTGTLNGSARSWDIAWQTDASIYAQDRGGYAPERVEAVVTAGKLKAAYGCPTNLVIRGLSTLGTGKVGRYELFAQFEDGAEMPVDYGVDWEVVRGNATFSDAHVDGRDVGALCVNSGTVVIRARSTFYFTGTKSMTVDCAPETDIESVEILTSEVNLEDNATPTIEAEATLKNGKKIPVFGFGAWEATFDHRIARADPELEENSDAALKPTITVDDESRLNYALNNGLLEVCDQVVNLKLTVNGKSHTKQVTVWGPTKVIPSEWTVVSAATQTTPGVVRLSCAKLKYNYGGEIKTTTDSYFASYEIVLKNGIYSQVSHLRGLTVYVNDPNANRDYKVSLRAKKVNGKYTGYLPAAPDESSTAPTVSCLARGADRTALDKGLVPNGFFQAFFPGRTDYETLAEEDADGDGFKNWEEYVLGTDPTNKSDAFTLMQGYQHLAAPAANGATMQYKVMYQQRAGRVYYIDGKKAWEDEWTQVASVNLANMNETDVTSFAYPTAESAAFADGCNFFRVRAALCEHEFNYHDTMPIIAPNMLVAAPGAIIDLSDGKALDLSSFDTDATDPGTVWVKVAADVAAGTALISAPKSAEKSLKACKPHERNDIGFAVAEENGKLVLRVAGDEPAVEGGNATVVVQDDKIVVTPNDGVTEITLSNVGACKVEIPSSVEKIVGVSDSRGLAVKSGGHDVTQAMKFTPADGGFKIELDETAVVTVGDEEIPVCPVLADGDNEVPFEIKNGQLVFNVKTIPGLKYEVVASDSLDPGGFGSIASGQGASSSRCELKVDKPSGKRQGFYKIQVGR